MNLPEYTLHTHILPLKSAFEQNIIVYSNINIYTEVLTISRIQKNEHIVFRLKILKTLKFEYKSKTENVVNFLSTFLRQLNP